MNELPDSVAIITGDPSLPDPTKHGQAYGPADLAVHDAMRDAFATLDAFEHTILEKHAGLFDTLEALNPDLVVNFCDTGLFNRPDFEIHVATQLEVLGLPYTGAPPRGILLCYDKQVVRLIAEAMGMSVPAERFVPAAAVRRGRFQLASLESC